MATPFPFMLSRNDKQYRPTSQPNNPIGDPKPETPAPGNCTTTTTNSSSKSGAASKGGRRNGKQGNGPSSTVQKKQPQRGLGVEKLEKLRLQDHLNKMAPTPTPAPYSNDQLMNNSPNIRQHSPTTSITTRFHHVQVRPPRNPNYPFIDPPGSIGIPVIPSCLNQAIGFQRSGSTSSAPPKGIHGTVGNGQFLGINGGLIVHDQGVGSSAQVLHPVGYFQVVGGGQDLRRVKVVDMGTAKNVDGTGGGLAVGLKEDELPSIPNHHCCSSSYYHHKVNNNGDHQHDSKEDASAFKKKKVSGYNSCYGHGQGSVEVVAVHRKGNEAGGKVVMEYGFFPAASGKLGAEDDGDEAARISAAANYYPDTTSFLSANANANVNAPLSIAPPHDPSSRVSLDLSLKLAR